MNVTEKQMFKRVLGVLVCAVLLFSAGCTPPLDLSDLITEDTTVLTDPNGNAIPVYSDVALSALDPSLFIPDENGRMTYADDAVKMYTGVDVSVFQGEIDFQKVKADGVDFVMLRAGYRGYGPQGVINEDANFKKNYENAIAAGLKVGVYFFSQAVSVQEAKEEADFVLSLISGLEITYPVAYDWERIDYDTARTDGLDNETITDCALGFCDTVAEAGYPSVIYFNRSLGYFSYDLSKVRNHYFWLAEYGASPSFIYDFRIWQYTDAGTVDGISGIVDINISITDFSESESVG